MVNKREGIWWKKCLQTCCLFKYVDLEFLQLLFMSRIPGELIDLIEGERYRAGERRGLDRR
jgi:hypothetical protein